ncbi:MAG: hydrogenase maturation nickel metallochaperone HypA [Candidatus Latescibacteria bacterium]|nr:hydrogenase maturation nickel metallochaperone HypA [Candidatus Latescibacterota bacterium]
MHELSTSQAIARIVLDKAKEQRAAKVLRIEVEIGRLSFLSPDQVAFWVKTSLEGTLAEDAEVHIERVEPQISCRACGYRGTLEIEDDPLYHILLPSFCCPECRSSEIEIEKGRECVVKRIGIQQE